MPEKEWKKLYFCKSVEELTEKSKIKDIHRYKNINSCMKSLNTLYEEYEKFEKMKDMEKMYINLLKYVELVIYIQKSHKEDYKFIELLHGKKALKGLCLLEELKKELEKKYQAAKKDDSRHIKPSTDNETDDIKEKRLKKSEKEIDSPHKETVSCKSLMEYSKNKKDILIIDIRASEKFKLSRINLPSASVINIPSNQIEVGDSANKVEKKLDSNTKEIWKKRKEFDWVVILDEKTSTSLLPSDPIRRLMEIMTKYDMPGVYKSQPKYLEGGFEAWKHTYPIFCEGVNRSASKIIIDGDFSSISLDHIQYPELEDQANVHKTIKSPSVSINGIPPSSALPLETLKNQLPSINRETKPVNGKIEPKQSEIVSSKYPNQDEQSSEIIEPESKKLPDRETKETENGNKMKNNFIDRSSKPNRRDTFNTMDKENQNPKQNNFSPNMDKNIGSTLGPLKLDNNLSSSSLKRASSSPNISKLGEEIEEAVTSTPPKFDRSSKPSLKPPILDKPIATDGYDSGVARISPIPGLTGLKNLGNTCYMNSILQCVSNTTQLKDELIKFNPANKVNNKAEGLVAREVRMVVQKLWAGQHKSFPCDQLKNVVGKLRNSFSGSEQQDSHEFFTILMDWLHEDLNEPSPIVLSGAVVETGEKAWGDFRKKNNSIVLNLFYGQQKSTVTCRTCAEESITFEPFSNLSLLLPNESYCTLEDCLDLYLKEELITGWNCPKCKTAREATKKIDITRLPPVLVIHLKRFTSNGWCRKKQTHVEFPLKSLDMRNFSVGDEHRNEVYNLYAVSNHYGTMESGHYTAYCHKADGRWYKFDDTEVIDISPSNVKTPAAYILFYSAVGR